MEKSNSELTVNSISNNTLNYVGGAVAYLETSEIIKSTSNVLIENVRITCFGGLIGYSNNATIKGCGTSGTFRYDRIIHSIYLGGVVGFAQKSTITSYADETETIKSGSTIEIDVGFGSIEDKFVGAVVGYIGETGSLTDCYMGLTYQLQTEIINSLMNLGIYGYKDTAVTISGCHQLGN